MLIGCVRKAPQVFYLEDIVNYTVLMVDHLAYT
jgi:hypothetical protein